MNPTNLGTPYTAALAKFIFGEEMQPCPKCGSFKIGYSTPIKLDGPPPTTAPEMMKAWATARRSGSTSLEGTCCIMCRACGHLGPSVDVTVRTAEDVGKDPAVAAEAKRLWNTQPPTEPTP